MLDPAAGTYIDDTREPEAPECACGAILDDGECPRPGCPVPHDVSQCIVFGSVVMGPTDEVLHVETPEALRATLDVEASTATRWVATVEARLPVALCICDTNPGTTEGPDYDCPLHGAPPLPQWQPKSPAGTGATLESWGGWTADMDAEGATVATSRHGGSASGVTDAFVAKARTDVDAVSVRLHHPAGIVSCEVPWEVLGAMVRPEDLAEVLRAMGCPPEGLAALP